MDLKRTAVRAGAVGGAGAAIGGLLWLVASRPRSLPGRAELVKNPEATVIGENGAVRSTQRARLALPVADLERLWNPHSLENLGATYWHFLTRVTLGSVRVLYSDTDRRVTLLGIRALTLLRFDPPTFDYNATHAKIYWQIQDGLLVARAGRAQGGLALEVTRGGSGEPDGAFSDDGPDASRGELDIAVEITNYYPSLTSRFGDAVYRDTQMFVHVLVTNSFLRSLASLELHQSPIGRFLVGSLQDPQQPA